MSPIVVYYHDNDFKLARQGLNEFVNPGHKGLHLTHLSYLVIEAFYY